MSLFEINGSVYVYAYDETQARAFCKANGIEVKSIKLLLDDDLYYVDDVLIEIRSLTKKQKSTLLFLKEENKK